MVGSVGVSRREEHEDTSPVGHSWGDGDHVYAEDPSKNKSNSALAEGDTSKKASTKEFILHKLPDRQK